MGRLCYVVLETEHVDGQGYRAAVVEENEEGYRLTGNWPYEAKPGQKRPYFWGPTFAEAQAAADRQNEILGHSKADVFKIVTSSFPKSRLCHGHARDEMRADRLESARHAGRVAECSACAVKPGSPTLCSECLYNRALFGDLTDQIARLSAPIQMLLTCPGCNARHIDAGEFATKPHHTHACQACGMCWRPAVVATVGVQFLPGFKDGAS